MEARNDVHHNLTVHLSIPLDQVIILIGASFIRSADDTDNRPWTFRQMVEPKVQVLVCAALCISSQQHRHHQERRGQGNRILIQS